MTSDFSDSRNAVRVTARVFVLMARDPSAGCATVPVAVAGIDEDGGSCVSWLRYRDEAEAWRARVAAAASPLAESLEAWLELADGVSWDVVELAPPASPDLRGAVEAAVDEILAMGAP